MSIVNRFSARALLLTGAALLPTMAVAQTATSDADAAQNAPSAQTAESQDVIVVTGQTTRDRPLITSSADITYATREDIDRRAPRSTADMLELVPGIFVEATAGEASNNYSVRGLQGGGQRFVQLEEDGMPILYGGGGADFFFQQDLTIDRLEAVKGGSSGVLTVNGAGATINFISKRPNFKEFEGAVRLTGMNYGLKRADFYYSAPLAENLAFNFGGYVQSSPGVRRNPFDYAGYRIKGSLEYRFPSGGSITLSGRRGDMETAYYAPYPIRYQNGDPTSITGFDIQRDNLTGDAFAGINVPVSTNVSATGYRPFRGRDGIRSVSNQVRLDLDLPVSDAIALFAHGRYIDYTYDFNGVFSGTGSPNAGLASAVTYLTPGSASPINGLLTAGALAYPTAARFGIRNIRTGQVIGSNETGTLNALNGNGFLQYSTLNHDRVDGQDYGLNAGGRWEFESGAIKNSLTAGAMYYNVKRAQNQSATASVVNDLKNNSDIYDIVAVNSANGVIGSLTDSGLVSYGDWGVGIRQRDDESISLYANDEIAFGNLRIDGGIRWEQDTATAFDGQQAATNQAVPAGQGGIIRNVGPTFNGVYAPANPGRTGADGRLKQDHIAWTVGANYLITPSFSVYARYADGFQTNNIDPITTIKLYEAGARYQYGRIFSGSVTAFRTNFDNQNYNFINPVNPSLQDNINADLRTNGVEIDVMVKPIRWFSVDFQGVFQDPKLVNLEINGQAQAKYSGNRPERTPAQLWTVTPAITLPNGLGEIFGRYKFIGKIFADAGNGVALPSYGVTSAGVNLNLTPTLQVSFNAENIFNVVGLTEGNPRQGQTQAVQNGYFYGRGIVGATYGGSVTFRF